jgi:hypothetical protein
MVKAPAIHDPLSNDLCRKINTLHMVAGRGRAIRDLQSEPFYRGTATAHIGSNPGAAGNIESLLELDHNEAV